MNKPLDFAEYDDWNNKERKTFDKQVKFVQFHPSYDYTDFVEGLRPYEKGEGIGFRRQDGAFKKFCKEALKERENCYQKIEKLIQDKSINKDEINKILNAIEKNNEEFVLNPKVSILKCDDTKKIGEFEKYSKGCRSCNEEVCPKICIYY